MKKTALTNLEGWFEFLQDLTAATDHIYDTDIINKLIDEFNIDEKTKRTLKRKIFASSYEIDICDDE